MSAPSFCTLAVAQGPFAANLEDNLKQAEALVREAAAQGAQVVLLPELFEGAYFPREEAARYASLARPLANHPTLARMSALAAELEVVLPISLFERAGPNTYNSVVVLDADGQSLGLYRKSHIPEGPGYHEKFYFRPGDTGFKVFASRYARLGVGICWDQWFPEAARVMALMGAELLLYPTAIGSEPQEPELDTQGPWRRVMQGHAVANLCPVAAANRVGEEGGQVFYGSSFISDGLGELVATLDRQETGVATQAFDLEAIQIQRASWGFFRDRRPELYAALVAGQGQE